jgi:dUTPase
MNFLKIMERKMFKVLEGATAPTRATKYSAMVDLYANADVVIGAGETKIIPLGVKIDLTPIQIQMTEECLEDLGTLKTVMTYEHYEYYNFMKSHYLELHPRSSLRAKGLIIGVGIIDLDYPDELGLIVHNPLNEFHIDVISNDVYRKGDGLHIETNMPYAINKGDKIAQCTLVEHKGYLMGIESETERTGGFGSTDHE